MSSRVPLLALGLSITALAATLGLGVQRVAELERHEADVGGEVITLDADGAPTGAGEREIVRSELAEDDHVIFELCSGDAMDPAVWAAAPASAAIDFVGDEVELVDRRAIDAELLGLARRAAAGDGSCVVIGEAQHLATSGTFRMRLEWDSPPAFTSTRLRGRIIARPHLTDGDGNIVLLLLLFSVLVTLSGYLRVAEPPPDHDAVAVAAGRVGGGVALALLVVVALPFLLTSGSRTASLLGALLLAGSQVALALGLARPARLARLAWGRHPKPLVAAGGVIAAPIAGLALQSIASALLRAVPSTGEAPIETFVELPSGMMSFALVAVVVPIAEEVFFRGFLFGSLESPERARRVGAFVGAWLLFALVHLPQTWGNWGGLSSILVAGLGFTALRAFYRSTPVSALAHLVYNGLLAALALAASIATGG